MENGIIFGNKILDIVVISILLAQAIKVILSLFMEKRINFNKFFDTGSMPSSHTACVVSLATAVGIKEGLNSTLFVFSIVFAGIVIHDAIKVRRPIGQQAEVLNKIVENIRKKEGYKIIEKNLKELLGHTPLEVLGGAVIGFLVAFFMNLIKF